MSAIKTIRFILSLCCALLLFVTGTSGQSAQVLGVQSGAATMAGIACRIIAPIGITKLRDMSFGTIISGTGGTVVLSPDGEGPASSSGGLKTSQGVFSAASFEVTDGIGNGASAQRVTNNYSVSLPTTDVTLVSEEGKTMRVSNFTSNFTKSGMGTFTNGTGLLSVGATLYVNDSQEIGKYQSAVPFPVTVNFH